MDAGSSLLCWLMLLTALPAPAPWVSSLDAASTALSLRCVQRNPTTRIPGTLFDSEKSFATLKALFVSRRVEYAVS